MNFKELRDNFRAKKISAKEAVEESLAKIKDFLARFYSLKALFYKILNIIEIY